MPATDEPAPAPVPPLPPREPPRLPGARLLRRRAPFSDTSATTAHPGDLLVRRGVFTAVVLRGNAPLGALWLDGDGRWRAALGAWAALAVSGEPDEAALDMLEERAPAFRRFAAARAWALDALGGDAAPSTLPSGTDADGGGQLVQLASRRRGR